ncbi:MAG: hypothetical protein Q4C12_05850 [Clostridia bacterium]|nr:hypothetical protein [Clostridia bacterium]
MEQKEIRFIDSKYNELFRIKDGESIVVNVFDGTTKEFKCDYMDSHHMSIGGHCYHICEFAEFMERNGNTYRPRAAPFYTLEKIEQEEFQFMFAPQDETQNRGCICYVRGDFGSSADERLYTTAQIENMDNYKKYKTADFNRECDNLINYLRYQADTPILKSRSEMARAAYETQAERFASDHEIAGYRVTTDNNVFYFKCDPRHGQYNVYCYCYDRKMLKQYKEMQLENQEQEQQGMENLNM